MLKEEKRKLRKAGKLNGHKSRSQSPLNKHDDSKNSPY